MPGPLSAAVEHQVPAEEREGTHAPLRLLVAQDRDQAHHRLQVALQLAELVRRLLAAHELPELLLRQHALVRLRGQVFLHRPVRQVHEAVVVLDVEVLPRQPHLEVGLHPRDQWSVRCNQSPQSDVKFTSLLALGVFDLLLHYDLISASFFRIEYLV